MTISSRWSGLLSRSTPSPILRVCALGILALCAATLPARADLLEVIKERGSLKCGINTGLTGFAEVDNDGNWRGFDVDFCRALAAAVFGDKDKLTFTTLSPAERFTAIQSGEVDVLSRNTTWSLSRDTTLGLNFVGVNYYDGQGFIVPKALGVTTIKDLDGARICVQTGTTTELNLADFFRTRRLSFESIVIRTIDEVRTNYLAEACDAYTTDVSGLASLRTTLPDPEAHVILDEIISKEPLGPAVREGDAAWEDVVRWTLFALMIAEEHGITRDNVAEKRANATNPEVRRFLGAEGALGVELGLRPEWAYDIIAAVGHYGEIFEANLGEGSILKLERGLNRPWNDGGLQYAPPVR